MKYLKKKKKSVLPWVLVVLTVVLVALILILTLLPGKNSTSNGATISPGVQSGEDAGNTLPTQSSTGDLVIETPYVTLVYPGKWGSQILVEKIPGDPYRVVFTAQLDSGIRQEMFTIGFGGNPNDAVGVVVVSGKGVPVQVQISDIKPADNWSDEDTSLIYTMQECLNDVLAGLELTAPQQQPENEQPTEDNEAMSIETPAGELVYPVRWKDYLKLEIRQENGFTVEFYTELEGFDPVHLFDVHLNREQGIYVMDLTAPDGAVMKLYVDIFEIEADENWTDAQRSIVYAMQEDMNFLLSALME